MKTKSSPQRLQYLDWVRGLGAVIMLQGHVFDSYLRPDLRPGGAFTFSQFVGGMPPAMFLFLTGVTLAFLMDSSERKGMPPRRRVWTSLQRAGYLFFSPSPSARSCWFRVYPFPRGPIFCAWIFSTAWAFRSPRSPSWRRFARPSARAFARYWGSPLPSPSPLISQLNWSGVPWMLRAYIIPDHRFFGVFPWCAYLAFGVSGGSALRLIPADQLDRAMQWTALAAAGAIACCQYCAHSPYSIYAASDFWLNSPAQVLTKQSVILIMLAFAFVWTQYVARDRWSWIRQFGTTSLLVYWIHIELIYGRWMWFFKENLNVPEAVVLAAAVVLFMLGISVAKTRRVELRAWLSRLSRGTPANGLPDPLTIEVTE